MTDPHAIETLGPDWPAPAHVRALTTTRRGGYSAGAFAGLNLGGHVGDDPAAVARNRALLATARALPAEPVWLKQVHGCDVCRLESVPMEAAITTTTTKPARTATTRPAALVVGRAAPGSAGTAIPPTADAAIADRPGLVCAVLTADCLPVVFCDRAGERVAAAHAGWRGLAAGVLEATVAGLGVPPARLLAWLGPAIGPSAFEVGPEVRAAFVARNPAAAAAFRPAPATDPATDADRWVADLYTLARQRLHAAGVDAISGGGLCTWSDPARFFSYRRDGTTGRQATLVWLDPVR